MQTIEQVRKMCFLFHHAFACEKPFKCFNYFVFPSKYEQYVVVPTRRSTAEAFQILISHTFGDAGSPYLVGVVSIAKWS